MAGKLGYRRNRRRQLKKMPVFNAAWLAGVAASLSLATSLACRLPAWRRLCGSHWLPSAGFFSSGGG